MNAGHRCSRIILRSSYTGNNSASLERNIALAYQPQCLICHDGNSHKDIRHRLYRVEEVFRFNNDDTLPSYPTTLETFSEIFTVDVCDRSVCFCGETSQSQDPDLEEVV